MIKKALDKLVDFYISLFLNTKELDKFAFNEYKRYY